MADDDRELLAGVAAGSPQAMERLYDLFAPALYRSARRLLGNDALAQEAVQELFVGMVRGRAALAGVRNLRGYLFLSLRHAAGRVAQRERRQVPAGLDERSLAADAETPVDADGLDSAVRGLPPDQQEVLLLKIDAGMTFAQIGDALEISPNTAASRYRYALERLRRLLEKDR